MGTEFSNSKKKLKLINYTSRDFDSIKKELVGYAKRYYTDSYRDFNEASFGSLVLDSVAYIGDILSYYLDYQANETFLDTAIEYDNVVKIARQLGYKYRDANSSYGKVDMYVTVPADSAGAPDELYYPTIRQGSQFTSADGKLFTLLQDVYFGDKNNEILVKEVDATTNSPLKFAIKTSGDVVSGRIERETVSLGGFKKFRTVPLSKAGVIEVVAVVDSEGHEYFEVTHLAQEIIYKALRNDTSNKDSVASILKAVPVPRRFVLERNRTKAWLQFGYGSDAEITNQSVTDPSKITLQMHGRDYTTEREFDPTNLTNTDKFGISPSDTQITITYRVNDADDVNVASGKLNNVLSAKLDFTNQGALDTAKRSQVRSSVEVNNQEAITGDVSIPDVSELKQRVFSYYATQNRAVTVEDYQAIVYAMPPQFGAVRRCAVLRDFDSFKRNLNLYIMSEDRNGFLVTSNSAIKQNLKTWLGRYKMINDTIDILDANVVNFGIEFSIVTDYSENKFTALASATSRLRNFFANTTFDIGEPIFITDIYKQLQKVPNLIDVLDVKLVAKTGGLYSDTAFDFVSHLSNDGRYLNANRESIFELKYPNIDIQGTVV